MLRYGVDALDITPSRTQPCLTCRNSLKPSCRAKLLNIGGEGFQTSLINKLFATGFSGQAVNVTGLRTHRRAATTSSSIPTPPSRPDLPFYNESERITTPGRRIADRSRGRASTVFGNGGGLGSNKLPEKTAEAFVDHHAECGYRTGGPCAVDRRWRRRNPRPHRPSGETARTSHRAGRLKAWRLSSTELQSPYDVRRSTRYKYPCLYFTSDKEIDKEALRIQPCPIRSRRSKPLTWNLRRDSEKTIADTFARILNRDKVGANDDFFSIGGTSINAIKVVAALRPRGIRSAIRTCSTHARREA